MPAGDNGSWVETGGVYRVTGGSGSTNTARSYYVNYVDSTQYVIRTKIRMLQSHARARIYFNQASLGDRDYVELDRSNKSTPWPTAGWMRLDLRAYYAQIHLDVYLRMTSESLTINENQATAQVQWSFTDQVPTEKKEPNTASVNFIQTPDGWRIVNAWPFIQQIAASRSQ